MGKVKDPKVWLVDMCFQGSPEVKALEDSGHVIKWFNPEADIVVSPIGQMVPQGRLGYVVKKYKEVIKEING